MSKYKIIIHNSSGLLAEWPGNYKTKKAATQASTNLKHKFKDLFWKTYYKDIKSKVVKNDK